MTAAGIDACHLAGMGPVTLAKGQACTQAHTTHWYIHSHIHAHTTHRQVAHTGTHMHMAHTCTHVHTHMHMAHTCTHVHTRAHTTHTHAETRALGASGRSGGPVLAQWEGCLLPGGLRDTASKKAPAPASSLPQDPTGQVMFPPSSPPPWQLPVTPGSSVLFQLCGSRVLGDNAFALSPPDCSFWGCTVVLEGDNSVLGGKELSVPAGQDPGLPGVL